MSEIARRAVALASLAAFLVAALEVPLPAFEAKDLSRPFPCMHRRCGCMHADQCWGGCCCFTNRQKIIWAQKQRVPAPAYVATAARREAAPPKKTTACCGKACDLKTAQADHSRPGPSTTTAVQSRQCRGQAELWLTLGAVAPLPSRVESAYPCPLCDLLDLEGPSLRGIVLSLATPPPRRAA